MKWLAIGLIAFASMGYAQRDTSLTIEDALQLGRMKNRSLKISAAKTQGASAREEEAKAAMLPSLRLDAGYRRLSEVDPFEVKLPVSPTPITISPTVLDNYSLHLGLQQPLFTGFRLRSNARVMESLAEASSLENASNSADVGVAIITAYWGLYQAVELQSYVGENVSRMERYVEDTQRLMVAGLATRNDLLKVQVQLSSARLVAIDARHDVEVATMNLNLVLGLPVETLTTTTSRPGGDLPSEERAHDTSGVAQMSLLREAMGRRPDLQAMQLRVDASMAGVTAAQASWWPQLYVTGNLYHNRPNSRYLPTRDEFKTTWDVGVQLQFDLWSWGTISYQTEQARAVVRQNELLFAQMKESAALEIRNYSLQVRSAEQKTDVARLAVEQAEENVRITNDKFTHGLATTSDMLDASVALLQARTGLSGALVAYEISTARLKKALGEEF